VQDLSAGAVLGTEIPVSEALAAESALLFLVSFLRRKPAVRRLRATRQALLAQAIRSD
jgi:hypothetical protein